VLEAADRLASGASSNLAGVLRPLPSADDNRLSRLTRAGFLATRGLLQSLPDARWSACGVLHLARDDDHEKRQAATVDRIQLPADLLAYVDQAQASQHLGQPVAHGGWWFAQGGWVQPSSLCAAALNAFPERIKICLNAPVDRIERQENGWQLLTTDGRELATAPIVILAAGTGASRLVPFAGIPQQAARGQVSHLPAIALQPPKVVLCKHGYTLPAIDGICLTGATLQLHDNEPQARPSDHLENLAGLARSLPAQAGKIDPTQIDGRVGFRPLSPDRLPIVGPLPDLAALVGQPRLNAQPRLPGLWCVQGFGARGIVWSALMADLLLSRLEGDPLPLANDLVDAVDPGRFLLKSSGRPPEEDDFDDRT